MNTNKKKTTVLMIMDGFGLRENKENNAVAMARTPNLDRLMAEYPFVKGNASGLYVGLPDGQMGNSEVGHLNMGAGRIVYQDLTLITKEIEDGSFFKNKALLAACANAREKGTSIHFMGLLSDGGVHSHETHLYALLRLAKEQGLEKVFVHCFLDGRDTPPTSGAGYIRKLKEKMEEIGVGKIGTVSGRYYAMDRDKRWERVRKAYEALTLGVGQLGEDAVEVVEASYEAGTTDEFVVPAVITDANGEPLPRISDGDSVVFFNFRPDRAREISRAILDDDFAGFEREKVKDLVYVCFTEYDPTIAHTLVAYPPETMKNTLGEYISSLSCSKSINAGEFISLLINDDADFITTTAVDLDSSFVPSSYGGDGVFEDPEYAGTMLSSVKVVNCCKDMREVYVEASEPLDAASTESVQLLSLGCVWSAYSGNGCNYIVVANPSDTQQNFLLSVSAFLGTGATVDRYSSTGQLLTTRNYAMKSMRYTLQPGEFIIVTIDSPVSE